MGNYRKHWFTLIGVMIVCFSLLGYYGVEVYRTAPPIPQQVQTEDGRVLYTQEGILDGQTAWQSVGGMQLGSIWGHGAYQAPDWTADWLHRELLAWLELAAQQEYGKPFEQLDADGQAVLRARLKKEYRTNTFDAATGTMTVSKLREQAIARNVEYYSQLFSDAPQYQKTRESYAMKENTLPSAERRAQMAGFFFWTAWAAATERPADVGGGTGATYTNNWPHEPLIGNTPTAENMIWSIASVVLMIAGVGFLVWAWAFLGKHDEADPTPPLLDPLTRVPLTPSQRALGKYLVLVVALFIFQVMLGGFTAHYTVEGQQFYGIDVSQWFPYALVRTWHIQSALFWIATGFLAAGLFLAPLINGGKDPKYQKLGVDVLFGALFVVVAGSFIGNYLAIAQIMPPEWNFWLGHQGYEYVDLGRLWQIGKFAGIAFWLVLMARGVFPALLAPSGQDKNLLALLTCSIVAIGLFYGTGLFYGERTHLSVMEYWRWWVVHLWVEGFFEVFAVAVISFLFVKLGLVRGKTATVNVLFATFVFMAGGVLGMFHHLYFAGATTGVLALGASFSALEVVPLALIGLEAYETWSHSQSTPWMQRYRWPIMFFLAVSFWNLVGAGLFGFLINTPLALYYMQGLNLTPLHGHTALFGVYGMLGIGLMLYCLRLMKPDVKWNEGLLRGAFWSMNIGLALMALLTLLPMGVLQLEAAFEHGYWYARSAEFMTRPIIHLLVWMRVPGDTVFAAGALLLSWFTLRLWIGAKKESAGPA